MQVKCPVCHMQVPSGQLALVYRHMHFAFCSEQCRERFQATPHLYVGSPRQKAAKQEGLEILKQRCYRFDRPLSPQQALRVSDALAAMMGVKQVIIEDTSVRIQYDLLEATAEQIEKTLLHTGTHLGEGWTARLRRALVHYTEDCEAQNLQVSERGHHHHR